MSNPSLAEPYNTLESQVIDTMMAAYGGYPKSHSDYQRAVRGLFKMFEVTRRPLAIELPRVCSTCRGGRYSVCKKMEKVDCTECNGTGIEK